MDIPILKYMGLTILYVIFTVLVINHAILNNFSMSENIPTVFQGCIYSLLMYWLWGYYVSIKASENKCNKKDYARSVLSGLTISIVAIIAYIVCYFAQFLQAPFIELFGNKYGNSIAEIFFISLNIMVMVIRNYFNIAKKVCKVDPISLTSNFKELDSFLDTVPCNKKADGTCEEINTCSGSGSG